MVNDGGARPSQMSTFAEQAILSAAQQVEAEFLAAFSGRLAQKPRPQIKAKVEAGQRPLNRIIQRCHVSASGCWEWMGAGTEKGYGRIKIDGRLMSPHRVVAWAMGIVESLSGADRQICVMHLCDNPKCCNPDHLAAGTNSQNMLDCSRKGRLRIKKGSQQTQNAPPPPATGEASDGGI